MKYLYTDRHQVKKIKVAMDLLEVKIEALDEKGDIEGIKPLFAKWCALYSSLSDLYAKVWS
jgi:uncharacterized membrane protein (DUF106 family)